MTKEQITTIVDDEKQKILNCLKTSRKFSLTREEIIKSIGAGSDDLHLFDYALEELLTDAAIIETGARPRAGGRTGAGARLRGGGRNVADAKSHGGERNVADAKSRAGGRTGDFDHAGKYALMERAGLIKGVFSANERGFGFVRQSPPLDDLYVAPEDINGALDQDIVLAASSGGGRGYAKIISIVEHAASSLVGTLEAQMGYSYVIPDDKKITVVIGVANKDLNGARKGQKVLVEITSRGTKENDYRHFGKIVEIIGYAGDPGVDIASILIAHGFAREFSDAASLEAESLPDKADARRFRGRRDLRGDRLFTIDGEGAKDLDDAVSIELLGGAPGSAMYKLGVHIADVSAYVTQDSALDRDAQHRGTSLYYADRVVPMLPQKLSNGICSLHPGADRLALTVFMYIDGGGKIVKHEIIESVIRSARRLSYENVYSMLEERDPRLREEYAGVLDDLELMRELADKMRARRIDRGALDFELRECEISLDENGEPLSVGAAETTFANRIIEEFMIACNETVAERITEAGLPFVYRTHGDPDVKKIEAFIELANGLGFKSRDIHAILELSRGTKYEKLISYLLLRSLEKAEYTAANIGHYGLASQCYCHFTAPIRRYPDLVAHRIVKCHLGRSGMARGEREFYENSLKGICEHSSERERAADDAERDIEALKKAEYMKQFIGNKFTGAISGVTSFGMFVELENTVEGLVRLTDLRDDYYEFDGQRYTLTGKNSGKIYRIGDAAEVVLTRVDIESRQIDFVLVDFAKKAFQTNRPDKSAAKSTKKDRYKNKNGKRVKRHG